MSTPALEFSDKCRTLNTFNEQLSNCDGMKIVSIEDPNVELLVPSLEADTALSRMLTWIARVIRLPIMLHSCD